MFRHHVLYSTTYRIIYFPAIQTVLFACIKQNTGDPGDHTVRNTWQVVVIRGECSWCLIFAVPFAAAVVLREQLIHTVYLRTRKPRLASDRCVPYTHHCLHKRQRAFTLLYLCECLKLPLDEHDLKSMVAKICSVRQIFPAHRIATPV